MTGSTPAEPPASRAALSASPAGRVPTEPALIGLAHGSRHPETAVSLGRLMTAVAGRAAAAGTILEARAAFLDLTDPDLQTVAAELRAAGHRRAVAVPLLFTSSYHATVDVPQTARAAIERSGLSLDVAPILGSGDDVLRVLEAVAEKHRIPAGTQLLLYAVGSSDETANQAISDLAARLGRSRRCRVRAAFATRPPRGTDLLDSLPDPVAVLPLFTAPGLLLDPMIAAAHQRGAIITPPLETELAGLVLARYRQTESSLTTR